MTDEQLELARQASEAVHERLALLRETRRWWRFPVLGKVTVPTMLELDVTQAGRGAR